MLLTSLTLAACQGQGDVDVGTTGPNGKADSFGDFLDQVYCEPDSEVCIVEGDIPIVGREALENYYRSSASSAGALTVFRRDGVDLLWNKLDRFELTYCVSKEGFSEAEYRQVVDGMAAAAGEWEALAHVKYRHIEEEDARCEMGNPRVRFPVLVAPANASYIARAFFPYYDKIETAVRVNFPELVSLQSRYPGSSLVGILRHELGHTLGFRHEHIRPENNSWCREDDDFRTITEYDAKSTMHYPHCDGQGDWSLEMTELDAVGAAFFYPNWNQYRGDRCAGAELLADGNVDPACAPVVHEILELANTATFEVLDDWVGLDLRAVEGITQVRDTRPFIELKTLSEVSYLGPTALRKMYNYLYVDGRCPSEVDTMGLLDARCRPVVHQVLALANDASLRLLDDDVGLDGRAASNILAARAERPFTSLVELWEVGYVKAQAIEQIYGYLYP